MPAGSRRSVLTGRSRLALPKPHSRTAAILRDELDAGRLEGAPDRGEIVGVRRACAALEIDQRAFGDPRRLGELLSRKIEHGARALALRWSYIIHVYVADIMLTN
jgi:hypothetical protein